MRRSIGLRNAYLLSLSVTMTALMLASSLKMEGLNLSGPHEACSALSMQTVNTTSFLFPIEGRTSQLPESLTPMWRQSFFSSLMNIGRLISSRERGNRFSEP